jgi:hypothetical protein
MILRLFRKVTPPPDVMAGDCVRCPGEKGVGWVDSISSGFATVTRGRGLREILPISLLRQAAPGGKEYDSKP